MDISVIIPIYGVEKYIEQSLLSIFQQTKTEGVEFILINDCTPDKSMDIAYSLIERFDKLNIKVINCETNGGQSIARQKGMDAATGEYSIHFDPDDICDASMLEDMYNKAKEVDADVIICDHFITFPNREIYKQAKIAYNIHDYLTMMFSTGNTPCSLVIQMFKRSLYVNHNIRFVQNINMCEDLLICLKLYNHVKIVASINKAYYHYVQRQNSISNSIQWDKQFYEKNNLMKEIEQFLISNNIEERYKNEFMSYKLRHKYRFLLHSKRSEKLKYIALFPETTKYISKDTHLSRIQKFLLSQACKGNLVPINFYYRSKQLAKKLIKSVLRCKRWDKFED